MASDVIYGCNDVIKYVSNGPDKIRDELKYVSLS